MVIANAAGCALTALLSAGLLSASGCGGAPPGPTQPTQADEPISPEPPSPPAAPAPDEHSAEPAAPAEPELIALAPPPNGYFLSPSVTAPKRAGKPKLVQVSNTPNDITDDERWFRDNELEPPSQFQPRDVEPFRGVQAALHIPGDPELLVFEELDGSEIYLVGRDPSTGEHLFAFDLSAYRPAKAVARAIDSQFVNMELTWAQVVGERLYLSYGHRTYAESSKGLNAYVAALSLPDGELLWHSKPLVSNARNFALITPAGQEDAAPLLITGYGFTAEPDFLFVLDGATGAVLNKTKLAKGPSYILPKDGNIYVRTYDRDYVFRLRP
ncbi:hypothetical protein Hoch_3563 [Haliangium ochraceum DSM 14365]|uniref:Lipoprotein n=2 Tax=Haliangium ochraceum TaxID=80816 RepID=D0LWD3_HALO1|nr:hypothetical protein Hoch_3563 [Haliangium ochraceum DSM 14365]